MRRRMKHLMAYIYMPILFTLIGLLLMYIGGKPVIQSIKSVAGMVITNSSNEMTGQLDSVFSTESTLSNGTVYLNDINLPTYETLYGKITCKSIELEAPLYYGDSDTIFEQGVGQYMGSFIPGMGKPILIGGHDNTYFASLEGIKKGNIIVITTSYGVYHYKVKDTLVTTKDDGNAYNLKQNKEQLILYTCYPFGTYLGVKNERFFVYADKLSGPTIVEEETTAHENEK